MEAFSALLALCAGNSPVSGEFPAQRPVTRSFGVFFDLHLIKRLSKHSWGWWFETISRPLLRYCNVYHKSMRAVCIEVNHFIIPLLISVVSSSTLTVYYCMQFNKISIIICNICWCGVKRPVNGCQTRTKPSSHYDDVIMGEIASQITSLDIVYSTVYSGADQSKHQSSASLAFVWGIHRGPVNSPHKWPATRKMFPFDDVIMIYRNLNTLPYTIFAWGMWARAPWNVLHISLKLAYSESCTNPSETRNTTLPLCLPRKINVFFYGMYPHKTTFQKLWFEPCIQQRKTTCLLWIRKSFACARASKFTTTNMYIARARFESRPAVGSSGLNACWS